MKSKFYDVYGNFKGMTEEEKEADWWRRVEIARKNTMKIMAKTRKPIDKKEE